MSERDSQNKDTGRGEDTAGFGQTAWPKTPEVVPDEASHREWCRQQRVQFLAEPMPTLDDLSDGKNASVHKRAQQGVSGPGQSLPHADQIQASFGTHDVSHVKAHVGGEAAAAADDIGAQAYATGDQVAFARPPDLHTAAHEAAHVVQQRSGVSLKGGVGQTGDPYEQHADAVADRVVAGERAEDLLSAPPGHGNETHSVQRFSAREHQRMGNEGAGGAWTELAAGYSIPFGDLVALAGDHFSSIEQIRTFALKPSGANSRLEIEYARKWKLGANVTWNESDPGYKEARLAQESRYSKLAAGNSGNYTGNPSHFLNPKEGDEARSTEAKAHDVETRLDDQTDGSKGAEWTPQIAGIGSVSSYRLNHVKAIQEAAIAGAKRRPIDVALAAEAFACHYLTDSFSGGHVRTPRLSIKEHWDAKVPMFSTNLAGYMTDQIVYYLRNHGSDIKVSVGLPLIDTPLPSLDLYPDADHIPEGTLMEKAGDKVLDAFTKKARLSLGDLISGALHDHDNARGVAAHVHGNQEVLRGDGHAYDKPAPGEAPNNTGRLAAQAVSLSVRDIYKAKDMGASRSPTEVATALLDEHTHLYPAEEFLPERDQSDIADATNPALRWKSGSVESLMADPAMAAAIKDFFAEQSGEIRGLKKDFPGAEGDALEDFADRLVSGPMQTLREVVHWTPTSGSSAFDKSSRATDYIKKAKATKGGFKSLTPVQRLSLIDDMVDAAQEGVGQHNALIWELLSGMDRKTAMHVIPAIGWDSLAKVLGVRFIVEYPREIFA